MRIFVFDVDLLKFDCVVQPSAMLQRDAERRRSVLEHSVAAEAARRSENIVESRGK